MLHQYEETTPELLASQNEMAFEMHFLIFFTEITQTLRDKKKNAAGCLCFKENGKI